MAAAPTPLAELTGPIFLGFLFNWALFGALSVQVYIYYLAFPKDRVFPTKSLVAFVYVYEAIQTLIAARDGFRYFGSGWGNMAVLNEVGWIWISIPVMTGLISALTQIFYAWRIFILSDRSWYIPAFISLIALLQAGGAVGSGVLANQVGHWSELVSNSTPPTTIWLGGTAVCDVIIAGVMIYYLSKSRGGFQHTNALLVKLMRLTVETGLITATVAVLDLVMFLAFRHVNYHLTPAICLSKLYSNSLMALLSARMRIVGGRNTGAEGYDSTLAQQTWSAQGMVDSTAGLNTAVNIETTCIVSKSPNDFAMTADSPRAKPLSHGSHASDDPDSKGSLDSYYGSGRALPSYRKLPPSHVQPPQLHAPSSGGTLSPRISQDTIVASPTTPLTPLSARRLLPPTGATPLRSIPAREMV